MKIHPKCEICGHRKKATKKEILNIYKSTILQGFGISFIIFVSFITILLNTNLISPNNFSSFMGIYMTEYSANNNELELRELAVNLTNGCYSDEYCNAKRIYDYIQPFNYTYAGYGKYRIYDELFTIKTKHGDCKGLSLLYSSLLNQVGGDVKVICKSNKEVGHCWNTVFIEETNNTYLIDLAGDIFIKHNEEINPFWWVE